MSSRNPFRIRSFQRTTGDDQFVKLFAPSALDVLDGDTDIWQTLQYLRSAPGGGKTSLLRLMTPGPLRKVAQLASREQSFKDIGTKLNGIGALKDGAPAVLGVMLSFSNDYRDLSGLDRRALQVFRALFSARVVLAAVRAVLELKGRSFPDDLERVSATWSPVDGATIPASASGVELRDWAAGIEDSAYDVLDSMSGDEAEGSKAITGFDGLNWLATAQFFEDGRPIAIQTVLLLDEVQELTSDQRISLIEAMTALRKPLGIWVAERLQALQADDLLAVGVKQGRDYGADIRLEESWLKKGSSAPLRKFLGEIANRRVDQADEFRNRIFFGMLSDSIRANSTLTRLGDEADRVKAETLALAAGSPRYAMWLKATEANTGNEFERAVAWQTLRIAVERDRGRAQASFDFDALGADALNEIATAAIRTAAELMVCKAAKAPFYYGEERLALLSSANVDQFLRLAGDMFDQLVSARLMSRSEPELSAERQDELVKAAADQRWKEIPRSSERGHAVLRFLEGMAALCVEETYRPTVPYPPGVTGIAIRMSDRDLLIGPENANRIRQDLKDLRAVLAACVAHNLLEPRVDYRNKGELWLVLYFNRLLCAKHDLPLGYGGWRPQTLDTLSGWMSASKEARLV